MRYPLKLLMLAASLSSGAVVATGIPVFDAGNFSQAMITATNAVKQVTNQVAMIQNQVQSIQYQVQSLRTLGQGRFTEVAANLDNQLGQLDSMLQTVHGVSYRLNAVQGQFQQLFPANSDWSTKPFNQYGDYYRRWSDQVQDASLAAMKSQAVIDNIRRYNADAQAVLAQSQGADGEVRQLQSVNQMLSVLTSQLGDMTLAMTTSARLSASAAAAAQAEQDAQRELLRQFAAPVTVPVNDGERF
jgi:P-type conjugative transfer protein TrbJ